MSDVSGLHRPFTYILSDFVFLTIDFCGAFFSLLALVAQNEFDVLFGTMYALW
jgi:hypothetical protein